VPFPIETPGERPVAKDRRGGWGLTASGEQRQPKRDELAVLRWIAVHLAPRTRAWAIAGGVLALAGRLGGLGAAWLWADGKNQVAVAVAIGSAAVFLVKRTIATSARVDAECDLHLAVSRSLLACDVIEEPEVEPHLALSDGIHAATDVAAHSAPTLGAELIASVVAAAALAAVMTPRLLLVAGVAAAVVAVLTVALRARVARLHARAVQAQEILGTVFTTTLHGRLELVASRAEDPALARVADAARSYGHEAKRSAIGVALLGRAPLAAAVVVSGVLVAWSADPAVNLWDAHAKPLIVLAAALPILLNLVFGLQEMLRYVERLRPFAQLVLRPERPDVARRRERATTARPPTRPSAIELDDVSFTYRSGGPKILDRLSLSWRRGDHAPREATRAIRRPEGSSVLVLRGPNGSGKSTALRLMLGLRDPDGGRVRVGGVDLKELDLPALRATMAYLPQRPYLGEPHSTILDSFRLLAPDASESAMSHALARVGLLDALTRGAMGPLARTVGELSVGQRQRVALARVLLRGAEVVLLDEPDANLDADGIARLVAIVEELGEDHMVAVAAHGPVATSLGGSVWELETPT
jgi:ABC-type multidrug transport system fused ATPase/permease subunit